MPVINKISHIKSFGIPLVLIGTNEGKQQVFSRLGLTKGTQSFHFPIDSKGFFRGYDTIYFKQLIAEHKVYKTKNGIVQAVWEPVTPKARNEALDLRVYNLAAFESLKDKINWRKLAEQLGMTISNLHEKAKQPQKIKKASQIRQATVTTDIW